MTSDDMVTVTVTNYMMHGKTKDSGRVMSYNV